MRQKKGPGSKPGQKQETGETNNLRHYNITNPAVMQAGVYPPGWLIARMKQPPPANPITRRQGLALLNLIRVMGLEVYRTYKNRLGIPTDTPIHRLSKQQAFLLIRDIVADLEAAK